MSQTINGLDENATPANGDKLPMASQSQEKDVGVTRENFLKGTPLPADTVDEQAIENGSVTTNKLGDGAVTPAKRSGGHAVGSFTVPGSTGNYSVNTLDFEPGSVEFSCVAASGANARSSLGFTDGTNQSAVASVNTNATVVATNACILAINTDGGNAVRAGIVSLNADGFTVNFTVQNTAYTVIWKATR